MNAAIAYSAPPENTRELIEFPQGISADNLPADVLDRARYFLLDYLSVAVRGSMEESAAVRPEDDRAYRCDRLWHCDRDVPFAHRPRWRHWRMALPVSRHRAG